LLGDQEDKEKQGNRKGGDSDEVMLWKMERNGKHLSTRGKRRGSRAEKSNNLVALKDTRTFKENKRSTGSKRRREMLQKLTELKQKAKNFVAVKSWKGRRSGKKRGSEIKICEGTVDQDGIIIGNGDKGEWKSADNKRRGQIETKKVSRVKIIPTGMWFLENYHGSCEYIERKVRIALM